MTALDIIIFILVIAALGAGAYFLHKSEVRTKNKHKMIAYDLLEQKNPDPKKIKDTIKLLLLYGGRWRKDQEVVELARLLSDLLNEIEKSGAVADPQVKG